MTNASANQTDLEVPSREIEPNSPGSRPVALTVAGFDPSSGAGITADLKTFSAHDVYGVACISALTVQSTRVVRQVKPVPASLVRETLDCLIEDIHLSGVKIGMLGTLEVVRTVASFLKTRAKLMDRQRVVLDPVLCSSSGMPLIDPEGIRALRDELLVQAGWITPNVSELAILTDRTPIAGRRDLPSGARRLKEIAAQLGNPELNVVVTGGHLDPPDDFLLTASGDEFWFPGQSIATTSTHGTGCAFSSALLCSLISGNLPADAVAQAKAYVTRALLEAYPVGKGRGPMNHLFRFDSKG